MCFWVRLHFFTLRSRSAFHPNTCRGWNLIVSHLSARLKSFWNNPSIALNSQLPVLLVLIAAGSKTETFRLRGALVLVIIGDVVAVLSVFSMSPAWSYTPHEITSELPSSPEVSPTGRILSPNGRRRRFVGWASLTFRRRYGYCPCLMSHLMRRKCCLPHEVLLA